MNGTAVAATHKITENIDTNTTAATATTSTPATAPAAKNTETTRIPAQEDGPGKDKEGPCGLPAKCVIQ
jgi:hypothetical protein